MDDVYDFDEYYGEDYADLEAHLYGLIHHRETTTSTFSTLNISIIAANEPQEQDRTSFIETLNSEEIIKQVDDINKEIPLEVTTEDPSNDQQEYSNKSENSQSDAVESEIETIVTDYKTPDVNLIESEESDNDILFIPTEIESPILNELEKPSKHIQSNSETDKNVSKYSCTKKKNTSLNNKRINDFIVIDSTSESDDDDEVVIIEPPPIIPICIDSSEELEPEVEVKEQENKSLLSISKITEEINVVNLNTSFISPDLPSTSATQSSGSCHVIKGTKCPSPSLSTISDDFIQNDCEKLNITENNSLNFNFSLYHLDDDNSSNNIINSSFGKSILTNSLANKSNEFLQNEPFEFSSQSERNPITRNFSSSVTSTPLPKYNSKDIYSSDEDNNSNRANDCFATPNRKTKRSVNMKTYAIGANFSGRAVDLYESESSDLPESICEVSIRNTPTSKSNNNVSTTQNNLNVHNLIGQTPKSTKSNSLEYLGINMNEVHKNSMIRRHAKYWSSINSFYEKSWGDEHFSHSKIISKMIGGRQNWSIDYNDINPSSVRKNRNSKLRCHNCQQLGHILSTCPEPVKPILCYTCGTAGHREPRCPAKLCLRCGSPSKFQVPGCSKCRQYSNKMCSICKVYGHIKDICPDVWRRYHLSTDYTKPLTVASNIMKDQNQIYCCNCGRKGHYYLQCRELRYSEHTLSGANIVSYKPMYPIEKVNFQISFKNDSNNLSNSDGRSVEYKNTQMGRQISDNISSKLELNSNDTLEAFHLKRRSTQLTSDVLKKQKNAELCINHSSESQVKIFEDKPDNNFNPTCDVQSTSNINKSQHEVPMKFCNNDYKNFPAKVNIDKTTTPAWLPEYISFHNNESLSTPKDRSLAASSSSNNPEKETNKIYLSNADAFKLLESDGSKFLVEHANENEILIELKKSDDQIYFLVLDGPVDKQLNFRMRLANWLRNPRTIAFKKDLVEKCPPVIIPQKKLAIQSLLKLEIDQLDKNIGNPCVIYGFIKSFEKKNYSTKKLKRRYYKECKDLNMILFGQLGYREGKEHLNWLKNFIQTKDSNKVSVEMRKELINHFKYIFSSIKHENYEEIINDFKNRNVMVLTDADNKITEVKLQLPAKIILKSNNEVKDLSKTESTSVVELRNSKRQNSVIVGDLNVMKNSLNFIQDGLHLLQISNSQFSDIHKNHFKMLRKKIDSNTFNYGDYRRLKMYYKDLKFRSKRQS